MPAKHEQKQVTIAVRLPDHGHPRTMFFNRFRVLREDGVRVVHFGLELESEGVVDHFSCALTDDVLENNKKTLLDYLVRNGQPGSKAVPWKKLPTENNVAIVDVISMATREMVSETVLSFYSMTGALRLATQKGQERIEIDAEHTVLLRSSSEAQRQLLVALYEE